MFFCCRETEVHSSNFFARVCACRASFLLHWLLDCTERMHHASFGDRKFHLFQLSQVAPAGSLMVALRRLNRLVVAIMRMMAARPFSSKWSAASSQILTGRPRRCHGSRSPCHTGWVSLVTTMTERNEEM